MIRVSRDARWREELMEEKTGETGGRRPTTRPIRRVRQMADIARELKRINRRLGRLGVADTPAPKAIDAQSVRALIDARRRRDTLFGVEIGEVAWLLLLEAYAARLDGRRTVMTGLGLSLGISRSTAHRWVTWLIEQRLLARRADPRDDRIGLVALSDRAANSMQAYLNSNILPAAMV
jgi:DNA-binding MarR family transcriptional regulator